MKITRVSLAALLLSSAMFVFSCKKNSDTADSDTSGATDNAVAEHTSNDIVSMGAEASDNGGAGMNDFRMSKPEDGFFTQCATVTADTALRIITVTFNGSVCKDGRTRNGSIKFDYSGSTNGAIHYRDPGFNLHITSTNYTVSYGSLTHSVTIDKNVTNTTASGFNPQTTNETWHIVGNLSITKSTGGTITWACDRSKTLLNTSDTNVYKGASMPIVWSKARVGFTGSASGTGANGKSFVATVTDQLVRDFSACGMGEPFVLGKLDFTPNGKPTRHIDYGYSPTSYGSCDHWISVTINSNTYYKQIW